MLLRVFDQQLVSLMKCGCRNVSMPFGCHLFVSCQAAVGSHLLNSLAEELPRVAQALIDALKARGSPRAFTNAGAGARGRRRA